MSIQSSISVLKSKWNTYIKTNYQQLITGIVLNSLGHDIIDTLNSFIETLQNSKLDKTAIGFDPVTGINLPAGLVYKQNGVDIVSLIINGGGPAGLFDASGGIVPTTGTGNGGAIINGNFWRVNPGGTIIGLLPNAVLNAGDIVVAGKNNASLVTDFYMIPGDQELAQILSRLTVIETKLATIENGATGDQSNSEIRDSLTTLLNDDRLDSSAIKNILNTPYINMAFPDLNTIGKVLDNFINYNTKKPFSYLNENLDAEFSIIITHGLDTLVPEVVLFNGEGIREVEMNIIVGTPDADHVKITHAGPISGTYHGKIIK